MIFHGAPLRENKGEAIVLSLRLSYHLQPFAGKATFESQQNTGRFNLWTNNSNIVFVVLSSQILALKN